MTDCLPCTTHEVLNGDCLDMMRQFKQSGRRFNLVFGSPPYEDRRKYGELGFSLRGEEWVTWMVERILAALEISDLVGMVVEGFTSKFRWSATPALLMADLHRAGVTLRKPPIYFRNGIPGSGGPDWWRNDYEFVVCCTNGGKLPWSENTAMGHSMENYRPGGPMSNRRKDGKRVSCLDTHTTQNGDPRNTHFHIPERANPGNVIDCGNVGGGNMGSNLCHENEAPFSEKLAERFVRSFCPPGGWVLDPFCGSGTTLAVAKRWGRNSVGIDIRESQRDLSLKRLAEVSGEQLP